jgi:hypothetical protein
MLPCICLNIIQYCVSYIKLYKTAHCPSIFLIIHKSQCRVYTRDIQKTTRLLLLSALRKCEEKWMVPVKVFIDCTCFTFYRFNCYRLYRLCPRLCYSSCQRLYRLYLLYVLSINCYRLYRLCPRLYYSTCHRLYRSTSCRLYRL